ncbi:MAG: alkaline phosphatase family protein [Anaerolineales bacterium]|nr:alkaline phosphatase family protein [Anaerolineales bacterium]
MQTVILGLDAFDPAQFERLSLQGKLPALTQLAQKGTYSRFTVSSPPQSEVSWTSIATGLDPAGHGLFDFVHRDPRDYNLIVSLLPTQQTRFGIEFVRPYEAHTLFDEAAEQGYPATALWWPATFPARLDSPVRNIPGLGTPDIHGRLGVGAGFSTEKGAPLEDAKIPVFSLIPKGKKTFIGSLLGPAQKAGKEAELGFELSFADNDRAQLLIGKQRVELKTGVWSPILEISFKMGFLVSVHAITRVILTAGLPSPRLYFLPLQIHPLHPLWRYASPPGFVKQTWQQAGGYLSLGWPQDTTALEEGHITDAQFLALCDEIFETRKRVFLNQLEQYQEGVLAAVFDTLDRVQHMFWRDHPEVIESWYEKLDGVVGQAVQRLSGKKHKFFVVSDHGFTDFRYKAHVNRWLEAEGFLIRKNGVSQAQFLEGTLSQVDWGQSQAYALGLNSLYLNLAGREGQGRVSAREKEALLQELQQRLLQWKGPDGQAIFQTVTPSAEIHAGPYAEAAPDLILGFSPGYRASADTGLGKWQADEIEVNHDHWGADHCIDAASVPGVLFSNQNFHGVNKPSFRDFPTLAVGMTPKWKAPKKPIQGNADTSSEIEERLKGLGYL